MRALLGLLFVALLAPASAQAEGNATGNGGGVICIAGKCQTLIEAGLRLSPEFDGVWLPSSEHYSEVEKLLISSVHLPKKVVNDIYIKIFGRADHFRSVEVVDLKKLEAIKQRYLDVAEEAGFPVDPKSFKVVAFSSDDTVTPAMTYLLPSFFSLDLGSQTRILIHEGLYRARPTSNLKLILQLESSMAVLEAEKYQSGQCKSPSSLLIESCLNQPMIAYQLGLISKTALVGSILQYSMIGNYISFGNAIPVPWFGDWINGSGMTYLNLDPRKVLAFGKVERRIPYILSKISTLNFKLVATKTVSNGDSGFFSQWDDDGEPIIVDCVWDSRGDKCSYYQLTDSNKLEILLPQ